MPEPLHEDAAMLDLPSALQVAAAHTSPVWVWQPLPLAAQSAFVPQACSAQLEAQQTLVVPLLTQAPLAQSLSAVQAVPSPTGGLH
ncbi:MAG TPA: hypothetical protein VIU64_18130 [Polyangia bacterium]